MSSTASIDSSVERAASLIEQAEALIVAAGAGMGVDSGLPDFRGKHGFWRAYPALREAGIDFYSIASPVWWSQSGWARPLTRPDTSHFDEIAITCHGDGEAPSRGSH